MFLNPNGSLLTQEEVRTELKVALISLGFKEPKAPQWRPHSLRLGVIYDLIAAGVPAWLVKKYARHTPDSKVTWTYTHLRSEEEAKLVCKTYLRYLNE